MVKRAGASASHLLQYGFFAFLFVGTIVLAFFLFKPFLSAIFLAMILAVVCHPFYIRAVKVFRGRESLASLATVLFVLTLIILPLGIFAALLFREVTDIYFYLFSREGAAMLYGAVNAVESGIGRIIPGFAGFEQYTNIAAILAYSLRWIAEHLDSLFAGIFSLVLNLILMFLALAYFLKEGRTIMQKLVLLSPLNSADDQMILKKIITSINTVLKGRLAMGAIQGVFSGLGFAFFGVPNPVFLGFLAGFCSLVPTVGTALVIVPAIAYLFFLGDYAATAGLVAWGAIAVGLIDDILGPYLIEREMKIHPFLILISVLGGLELFGLIGFVAGPTVLAVLFVLGEIYIRLARPEGGAEKAK